MMNFMSGNPGFYEEMGAAGRAMSSSSSSPSSSVHHRGGAGPLSSPTNNDDSDDLMLLRQQGSVGGGGSSNATTVLEREHMFDKVVTPSDVGKLNRLVIPKQHAEKYFPLDSSNNEKGLLLNFEDRNGKPWRFRYSYWNSSQSYVMTKGWSRFVKEKKLDAGDIVSFQRGVGELGKDRLFIDWRRRPDAPDMHHYPSSLIPHHHFSSFQRSYNGMNQPWNPLYLQQQPASLMLHNHHQSQQYHHHHPYGGAGGGGGPSYSYNTVVNGNPCPPGSIVYLRSGPQGGGGGVLSGGPQHQVGVGMGVVHHMSSATTNHEPVEEQMVFDSVPVVQGKAAAKRLRLFGVNMDCPISESDECDILSTTSTTTIPFHHLPHPNSPNYSSSSSQFIMQPNSNYSEEEKGKGTTTSMSLDLDI